MIIDAWMQHLSAEWIRNPMFDSLRRWKPGKWSETSQPIEATITEMDQAGVSVGLLCAWHAPSGPLISNDEVAQYCRAYPDRFVGIASVDLYRPMDAVRELRRRVKHDGFKGLRVLPWLWGLPPDDRRYYPLFMECCELDIPFCTQVGHAGPLRESEPGRPIPYLDRVALEFPELRILAGHIGVPWLGEMLTGHEIPQRVHRYVGLQGLSLSQRVGRLHARQCKAPRIIRVKPPILAAKRVPQRSRCARTWGAFQSCLPHRQRPTRVQAQLGAALAIFYDIHRSR